TLSRAMDFIETLLEEHQKNVTVYDFLKVKTKFERDNNCRLDYIYPIYEIKKQRPEIISEIINDDTYYDEDKQKEHEKYKKLKVKKDENGDYEFEFSNKMIDNNAKQTSNDLNEAKISRRLAKISGGSEKLFFKNSVRYHRITRNKVKKWLKKNYSNITYDKFLALR